MSYIRKRDGSTCGLTDKGDHGCGSCRKKYDNGCGCNSTTDGRRRRRRSSKRSKRRSKRRSRRSRRRRS